jgi:hypothetical protein
MKGSSGNLCSLLSILVVDDDLVFLIVLIVKLAYWAEI